MRKPLAALAVLLCLAACQWGVKTRTFTDEMKLPLAEGRADTLTIRISLEIPSGADSAALAMTRSILSFAFDMDADTTTVEEAAERYEASLMDAYFDEMEPIHENEEDPDLAGIHSWEENITGYFGDVYKKKVSYYVEYYGYRGGAHGIPTLTPTVFSTETGAVISETEFFVDGYQEDISLLLRDRLLAALDNDADAYDALFVKDIAPNGCFDITRKGVTWYYQPYEIGPFYLGVISVSLPWEDLKEYVRE